MRVPVLPHFWFYGFDEPLDDNEPRYSEYSAYLKDVYRSIFRYYHSEAQAVEK